MTTVVFQPLAVLPPPRALCTQSPEGAAGWEEELKSWRELHSPKLPRGHRRTPQTCPGPGHCQQPSCPFTAVLTLKASYTLNSKLTDLLPLSILQYQFRQKESTEGKGHGRGRALLAYKAGLKSHRNAGILWKGNNDPSCLPQRLPGSTLLFTDKYLLHAPSHASQWKQAAKSGPVKQRHLLLDALSSPRLISLFQSLSRLSIPVQHFPLWKGTLMMISKSSLTLMMTSKSSLWTKWL